MKDISRREFLKYLGAGAAGLVVNPKLAVGLPDPKLLHSTVVQCYHSNATTGSAINQSVVQVMMDASIKALTGINDVGEAWKSLFPGITASSVISIKVNCFTELPTHPAFANCIAGGLTQMMFGGTPFNPYQVIVWDLTDAHLTGNGGYTINYNTPDQLRCFGSDHSGVGYDTVSLNVNGVTSHPSRILSQLSNYVIDAAVLKTHSMATVTLNLKNHYGSVNNPGSIHGSGDCDPEIPSLNQQIRDVLNPTGRVKIYIIDGLFGLYSGGPGGLPNCNPKKLVMSLDPVAGDAQGQIAINVERQAHGLGTISAPHIITASQAPYNLGTTDINLIEINNPQAIEENDGSVRAALGVAPNPFRNGTTITLTPTVNNYAYLDLIDAAGRIRDKIFAGPLAAGTHRIDYHCPKRFAAGTYFIRLYINNRMTTRKVSILKQED
jgi:hypothetical protein